MKKLYSKRWISFKWILQFWWITKMARK